MKKWLLIIALFLLMIAIIGYRLELKTDRTFAKIESLDQKIENTAARIESLERQTKVTSAKLESFGQKTDGTSGKLDSLVKKIEDTSTRVEPLDQKMNATTTKLELLEQKVDGTSAKMDSVSTQIGELRRLYDMSVINKSTGVKKHRPNVILIVSDALRADHISAINPKAEYKTVNIDRLAGMGALFTNAISQGPFTRSAMGSIFTGLYPSEHKGYEGLLPSHRYNQDIQVTKGISSLLDRLRVNGYGTYAITQNYNLGEHGMPITVVFHAVPHVSGIGGKPKTAIDETINFLKSATTPYFLYLHIMDPHDVYDNALDIDPSLPPRKSGPGCSDAATVNDVNLEHKKYSLEIQGVDRELGRLIDYLISRGFFKDNVLIFLADHGEYFNERIEFHSAERPMDKLFPCPHGFSLYQELIHVPLIIVTPTTFRKGIVVKEFGETRALFSTIIELTNSGNIDNRLYPQSLVPLMLKGGKSGYCISEGIQNLMGDWSLKSEPFYTVEQKAIISPDGLKLIHNTLYKTDMLYDLNKDPKELHPLDPSGRKPEILKLKRILANRIDIDEDFIKPEPYERILSMPHNSSVAGINASIYDKDHSIAYVLDEDPKTFWQNNPGNSLPVYLTLILKNPAMIRQLRIKSRPDNPQWFKKAHLDGSDDGYMWYKVADIPVTDYSQGEKFWDISVEKRYKYYRLNILELPNPQQNTVSIAELHLITKEGN